MRRLAWWLSCGGLTLLTALPAAANSGGITGASGRPRANFCNSCHNGGVTPEVRFIGPSEMAVGSSATFRFEVTSKVPVQDAAGFNVAAEAGTLTIIAGQDSRRANGELTHTDPKDTDDQQIATWDFTWTAPATPGSYRLFGAGNSVNLNRQSSGDRAAKTNFDVEVVLAVDPTATPTPSPLPPTATATRTTPPTASPTRTATLSPTRSATATPVATATITASATADTGTPTTPSATPTEGDATATATAEGSPTPTNAPPACVGDCNDNGRVGINEIIRAVNIALGSLPIEECLAVDANRNGTIAIGELVVAVGASLNGC